MQNGGNPFQRRSADCLTFCGVVFDQWDYDNHQFFNVV
jgi:hypothetical protein